MFRSKCPQTTVWRDHEYRKNEPVSTWSEERSPAALPYTPLQYMAWTTLTKAWYPAVAAMTRVTSFFTFVGVFAYHAPDPEGRISSHLPRAWLSIVHPRACLSYPIHPLPTAIITKITPKPTLYFLARAIVPPVPVCGSFVQF